MFMGFGARICESVLTPAELGVKVLYSCGFASNGNPKLVPVDEEPDDQIVHTFRLGKTDRATHSPLDPCP